MRREPANVRGYVDAARAYASRFDFQRMETLLDRLRQLAPRHAGVHHLAGETYALLKLTDRAIDCYQQACQCEGVLPETWVDLASFYERGHRLDDAAELIARAQRASPGIPMAQLVEAKIERRRGQSQRAEEILRTLLAVADDGSSTACQAWAELAGLLDKQGDYDGAMAAIAQCKSAQLARDADLWKASQHVLDRFRRMVDTLTQADFQRWTQPAADLPPQAVALLTGFPRSGTTLLEQLLDAHPQLVSSEERDYLAKELLPSFEAAHPPDTPIQAVLDAIPTEQLSKSRRGYLEVLEWLLGEPLGERMHLDKNPAYNLMIPVLLRLFPEAKLLVAIRDPRDVVLSCYLRYLPLNPVSVRFLTLERTAERYALDMAAWLKFRPLLIPTAWSEVRYEDLVADLEGEARRAFATLGLPWDRSVLDYRQRVRAKLVESPTYEAVAKPVYQTSIGRWQNYQEHFEPVFETLQPFVDAFGYV